MNLFSSFLGIHSIDSTQMHGSPFVRTKTFRWGKPLSSNSEKTVDSMNKNELVIHFASSIFRCLSDPLIRMLSKNWPSPNESQFVHSANLTNQKMYNTKQKRDCLSLRMMSLPN